MTASQGFRHVDQKIFVSRRRPNTPGRAAAEFFEYSVTQALGFSATSETDHRGLEKTRQLRALAYWADGRLTKDFLIDIAELPARRHHASGMVHYPIMSSAYIPTTPI